MHALHFDHVRYLKIQSKYFSAKGMNTKWVISPPASYQNVKVCTIYTICNMMHFLLTVNKWNFTLIQQHHEWLDQQNQSRHHNCC